MGPTLQFQDVMDAMEAFLGRGWTDGLPVVPPTPALVEEMLAGAGLAPDDVLGEIRGGDITVTAESVAVNAVMAGCRPAYMPVVAAAVRAALEPEANLVANAVALSGPVQALIINGPVRAILGINCKAGIFGPGFHPNATIGRALRLVISNVCQLNEASYGCPPFSQPGRYTWCFGENEEQSPWAPLHVERGFLPEASAATFYPCNAQVAVLDAASRTPEELLNRAAFQFRVSGWTLFDGVKQPGISPALVLGPEHVDILRAAGWTKPQVQGYLWTRLTAPATGYEDQAKLASLRQVLVIVAGGAGRPWSWWLTPHTSTPVTKVIEGIGVKAT